MSRAPGVGVDIDVLASALERAHLGRTLGGVGMNESD